MQTFEITFGGHKWEKQNLMTLGKKRLYDLYKCSCCGIQGKSYRFGTITIKEADIKKMLKCKSKGKHKRLKVTFCRACGSEFSNLIPGSIHEIINPPEGYDNSKGEWVQGLTEPVLLLSGEYTYMED
jgi:hypothetical protein